jgi:hypothetical protein
VSKSLISEERGVLDVTGTAITVPPTVFMKPFGRLSSQLSPTVLRSFIKQQPVGNDAKAVPENAPPL